MMDPIRDEQEVERVCAIIAFNRNKSNFDLAKIICAARSATDRVDALRDALIRAEKFIRDLATTDTIIMASTLLAEADALAAQISGQARTGTIDELRDELEHFVDIVDGTAETGFDPHVEQMLMDAAETARALLSKQGDGR